MDTSPCMSQSIQIRISRETVIEQWNELSAALAETEIIMRALGVPVPEKETLSLPLGEATLSIPQAVREYYPKSGGRQFSISDVRDYLVNKYPWLDFRSNAARSTISTTLSTDAENGALTLIEKGLGGKPSVYETAVQILPKAQAA